MSDGSSHPEGHAQRGRITGPSARAPAPGRTMSMVPSRSSSAVGTSAATASPAESPATSRSSTPQPSASRIQFRPVMPQRRRTPSASAPPVKMEAEERHKPTRPAPRSTPRPPREMTATGPFALGAAQSSSTTSARRAAALAAPLRATTPSSVSMATASPAIGTGVEARGVDIDRVHELDDMAPQSLMQAPPSMKREPSPTKVEPMDSTPDVNESQALDLSDNEDDAEEDMSSFLSSLLQSGQPSGKLFLFQFPQTHLAFQRADAPVDEAAPKAEDGAPPVSEGHIGHLDVYPSGRMVLRIGDMPYDVGGGSESSFLQQVMLLDAERQSAECLGELSGKVVVTPQLDALMERVRMDAAP